MDIARYGALSLTENAGAIISGSARFECKAIPKTRTMQRRERNVVVETMLSERDMDLLHNLKALRMTFAKQLGKPAFVVFSDATLMDMAQKRPGTKDEMLDVSGVGEVKFQRFGKAFLDAVAGQ